MLQFDFENSLSFLGINSVFEYIEENKKMLEDLFSPKEKDETLEPGLARILSAVAHIASQTSGS